MRGSITTGSEPEHVDAETVVSAFVGMLQVGFLYPANNPRVADVCARVAQLLQVYSPQGNPVVFRIQGEWLHLDQERFERGHAEVGWMLDRFDRAGLSGIALEPGLDPQALIEFAVALRKSFPPTAPPFRTIWTHDGLGVTPLLDGADAASPRPPASEVPPPQPAAAPEPPRSSTSSTSDSVLGRLARSGSVREALATIHARFDQEFEGREHFDAAGMLERLVADLPDAVQRDADVACGHVETVLDLVLAQVEVFLLAQPDRPGERLTEVASTLLRRRLPSAAPPAPAAPPAVAPAPAAPPRSAPTPQSAAAPAGHDAEALPVPPFDLDEDGAVLLRELEALPRADDLDDTFDAPACDDEVLGTALHLLAHSREPSTVSAGVVRLVDPLMAVPTPSQRRILGAYLRVVREGGAQGIDAGGLERVSQFLQQNGVQHLMATRETLDVEQVVRTFPAQLVMFLDALELKDPASERAFLELLDAVGDAAMEGATATLIEDGTLLTPNRTEKILKFGGRRASGIAKQFARTGASWTRAQVVNYLRRQSLARSESAALAIIQPVTTLPSAYLADLCDSVASGATAPKVHGYTSLLLRQYVRDTAERPGDLDRRLYAIRALGHWPTPETVQYLDQLAKEGRFLQQSKEARSIRQAATEALAQIRAMEEQQP